MLRQAIRLACAVGLITGVALAPAAAQTPDKRTLFTFSGPVAMPGVTLPAGQYLFRLADPSSSSNVVQVLNADGTKPYGMFFSIPAERLQAPTTPEVRFMETAKDMPAAIKTWWYPGESTGYEFIYPKDQARALARGASQPVLTTQAQTTTAAQTNTSDLTRVSSSGAETAVAADTKPAAATPAGATQEGTVASASLSIPDAAIPAAHAGDSAATPVARVARTRLPETASVMPLVAAIGIIAVVAGAVSLAWRTGKLSFDIFHMRRA